MELASERLCVVESRALASCSLGAHWRRRLHAARQYSPRFLVYIAPDLLPFLVILPYFMCRGVYVAGAVERLQK